MDSSFTRGVVWIAVILGAVGLLLYLLVFDVWVVPGDDQQFVTGAAPTLAPEDHILTSRHSSPAVGQLARCFVPDGRNTFAVGRVFGLEGDKVEINNERVTTNGKGPSTRFACGKVNVTHPVSRETETLTCTIEDNGSFTYSALTHPEYREGQTTATVEPGKIFLVSDDRHLHQDSRDFGQVDAAGCQHIVFRLWGDRFGDGSRRFNILW